MSGFSGKRNLGYRKKMRKPIPELYEKSYPLSFIEMISEKR